MEKSNFLNEKAQKAIRQAYRAHKKTIVLDGREFTITRRDRQVTFMSGGKQVKTTEKWLCLNPANGDLIPCGQIELTDMCNRRTQLA
jgi:hypothetical protein